MSKMLDNLAKVEEMRSQKYTLALDRSGGPRRCRDGQDAVAVEDESFSSRGRAASHEDTHEENEDSGMGQEKSFYVLMAVFALIILVSSTLSFKAFTQIRKANAVSVQLAQMMMEQKQQIKALEGSVAQGDFTQAQSLGEIKKDMTIIHHFVDKSQQEDNEIQQEVSKIRREIAALSADGRMFQGSVNDLKATNKRFLNKIIGLNSDVRKLMRE